MRLLITYDVDTTDKPGRKRLRKIAQACEDYGQRVQFSVFEVDVTAERWIFLRSRILQIIDSTRDSVRIYPLDEDTFRRVEHMGTKKPLNLDETLIA